MASNPSCCLNFSFLLSLHFWRQLPGCLIALSRKDSFASPSLEDMIARCILKRHPVQFFSLVDGKKKICPKWKHKVILQYFWLTHLLSYPMSSLMFWSFRVHVWSTKCGVTHWEDTTWARAGGSTYRQQVTISAMPMISRSPPPAAAITTVMSWYATDGKEKDSLRNSHVVVNSNVNVSTVLMQRD